jgi:hypothetical protein
MHCMANAQCYTANALLCNNVQAPSLQPVVAEPLLLSGFLAALCLQGLALRQQVAQAMPFLMHGCCLTVAYSLNCQ